MNFGLRLCSFVETSHKSVKEQIEKISWDFFPSPPNNKYLHEANIVNYITRYILHHGYKNVSMNKTYINFRKQKLKIITECGCKSTEYGCIKAQ